MVPDIIVNKNVGIKVREKESERNGWWLIGGTLETVWIC